MRLGMKQVALAAALAVAGCASNPGIEVTRFHLGQPIPSDTIELQPGPGGDPAGLEFRSQAAIVAADLDRHGLHPAERRGSSGYIGILNVSQSSQVGPPRQSPFSVGIGGFTGGSNVGIGGSVQVPVGNARSNVVLTNMLALQIRRRSENTMIWEGRAIEQAPSGSQATLTAAVPRLSAALLKEFPGLSGQTVRVKPTR
jgi:hypothetical protein